MKTHFDVAVIGAGVFGAWTAYELAGKGASVVLIDAYGPANSRASSGGESRIMRFGYGGEEVYTRSAQRSLARWQSLFEQASPFDLPLFHQSGVLWLAREEDQYCENVQRTLNKIGAEFEKLNYQELETRYPQFNLGPIKWGILELETGVLMARRAVQFVVEQARKIGVKYLQELVRTPPTKDQLESLQTRSGSTISADKFVFACGPWLPKVFPELLSDLFHITRQEVYFFGTPPGDTRWDAQHFPAWVDFNDLAYGLPDLENRGVKIAIDAHGSQFDPDSGDRVVTPQGLAAVRTFLAQRIPELADAPVTEARVCQYENTWNGDFLIDRHPEMKNVWIVGGGSGHGFKHGPAIGSYVTGLLDNSTKEEPRITLTTKQSSQSRTVY